MILIDTHAHVNFKDFKDDGDDVIRRAFDGGVQVINVGAEYKTSRRAVEYAEKYKTGVWAAVGLHPIHLFDQKYAYRTDQGEEVIETEGEEFEYEKYAELARHDKVVAIGETGLDYHHFSPEDDREAIKQKQQETFENFIDLANEVGKPMIVHCWGVKSRKDLDHARTDAYDVLYGILKRKPAEKTGVVHSFIGGHKTARQFIELGFMIGLNGIITYSESYDRLIREVGLEHIVVETDCPYLPPKPITRESRNEPLFVKHVVEKIAAVLGVSVEEVAEKTTNNARRMFALS